MKTRLNLLIERYLRKEATLRELQDLDELSVFFKEKIYDEIDQDLENDDLDHTLESSLASYRLKAKLEQEFARSRQARKLSRMAWMMAASTLLVVGVVFFLTRQQTTQEASLTLYRVDASESSHFVHLPDGTMVLLNEGSSLTHDPSFGEENREVTLIGEAYFDVAHDADKPFLVHTGNITTKVLGTAFNIKTGEQVVVTVARGVVEVGEEEQSYARLMKDQQIIVDAASHEFATKAVKAEEVVAWKEQYLVFDNVRLEEVIAQLEKHYHVKVILINNELKSCRISGTFLSTEALEKVIRVISGTVGATYIIERGQVTVTGGSCQ